MQKRDIQDYTAKYTHSDYSFEKIMVQIRRKKILEFLAQYKPKNVLEIGCGMESLCKFYNDFHKFVIIEPSSEFANNALKDSKKMQNLNAKIINETGINEAGGGGVNFLKTKNIESKSVIIINDFIENRITMLQNETFDFIILSSLLHEVINPLQFLMQIMSILKNDTILHINVPNAMSFHLLWAYKSNLLKNLGDLTPSAKSFQRHSTFTLESLINMVKNIALQSNQKIKILQSGSYFIKPFNHPKMQQCLDLNIIDSNLLSGLERMIEYLPHFGAEIFVNICLDS